MLNVFVSIDECLLEYQKQQFHSKYNSLDLSEPSIQELDYQLKQTTVFESYEGYIIQNPSKLDDLIKYVQNYPNISFLILINKGKLSPFALKAIDNKHPYLRRLSDAQKMKYLRKEVGTLPLEHLIQQRLPNNMINVMEFVQKIKIFDGQIHEEHVMNFLSDFGISGNYFELVNAFLLQNHEVWISIFNAKCVNNGEAKKLSIILLWNIKMLWEYLYWKKQNMGLMSIASKMKKSPFQLKHCEQIYNLHSSSLYQKCCDFLINFDKCLSEGWDLSVTQFKYFLLMGNRCFTL